MRVIELIPLYVDTNLDQGRRRADAPIPMPLDQFVSEAIEALSGDQEEIVVANARFLRATVGESFEKMFERMNG